LYFCSESADNGIFKRLVFISERTEKMVADTGHYYSCFAWRFINSWWLIGIGPIYIFLVLNENKKRNHNTDSNNRRFPYSFLFTKKLLAGYYCNGYLFTGIFHSAMVSADSQGMDGDGENIGLDQ
jgi:hypothetical protein